MGRRAAEQLIAGTLWRMAPYSSIGSVPDLVRRKWRLGVIRRDFAAYEKSFGSTVSWDMADSDTTGIREGIRHLMPLSEDRKRSPRETLDAAWLSLRIDLAAYGMDVN